MGYEMTVDEKSSYSGLLSFCLPLSQMYVDNILIM
jgi:hypothetical protein